MALISHTGSRNGSKGFTLAEALVSISILGMISFFTVSDLRTSQRRDELYNGARLVASDLRSLQSQALTAKNLRFCQNAVAQTISCEQSTTDCQDPNACTALPPAAVGAAFTMNASSYTFFTKYDGSSSDWTQLADSEVFGSRTLERSGAPNVVIDQVTPDLLGKGYVAFKRQNGNVRLNACNGCSEPVTLQIRVKHTKTGETKTVYLNSFTGRISIE
jgi:type II secretory pathway pseudopilin PulG